MSLKVKSISVRRQVSVLKKPTPTYVSFVDHAATQTPFAVVKNAHKKDETPMKRTSKKRTPHGTKTTKSSQVSADTQVYKLIFQQTEFKTEANVKSWLKKNQWTGDYKIVNEDGEFVVKSKTAKSEDQFDLREVPLDETGSVSALVSRGRDLGDSNLGDKTSKARKPAPASPLGNVAQNEDEMDPAGDGTDAAGTKQGNKEANEEDEDGNGDDDDANSGDDDDDDDASADDDDDDASEGDEDEDDDADEEDEDEDDPDYNKDNDPSDDDAEGAEDAAGVDDAEGYGDRRVGRDEDGKGGHKPIRQKEKNEPLPKDLPGQSITATGAGKEGHDPGIPGKNRIRRRKAAGRNPLGSVDRLVRKFDNYGVYLSGGMTLKEVLDDGLADGIPPGVSEVFQSLYKAVGNTLKSAKNGEIGSDISNIAGEFSEAVVALHGVWKGLLKTGTTEQKKAAKKYFATLENSDAGLQTFATPAKKSADTEEDRIAKAVAKAMAPITAQLEKANKRIETLSKPVNARKSLGNDDLDRNVDPEKLRLKKEADDDEDFLADRTRKGLFGVMGGRNYDR